MNAAFVAVVWVLLLTLFLFPEDYGRAAARIAVAYQTEMLELYLAEPEANK